MPVGGFSALACWRVGVFGDFSVAGLLRIQSINSCGITIKKKHQDRVLADRVQSDGRACIVVCNKWDLVEDKNDASYNKVFHRCQLFSHVWTAAVAANKAAIKKALV